MPEDNYTFWEHLYGLGQVLHRDYPFLFGNLRAGETGTQRVSFYLVGLVHGVIPRVNEIRQIPTYISMFHGSPHALDLAAFEEAARLACQRLVDCITPSAGMKLNSTAYRDSKTRQSVDFVPIPDLEHGWSLHRRAVDPLHLDRESRLGGKTGTSWTRSSIAISCTRFCRDHGLRLVTRTRTCTRGRTIQLWAAISLRGLILGMHSVPADGVRLASWQGRMDPDS